MNLHLLLFTQFGHEGESDLIRACPLGMPFYLLTDLVIKRRLTTDVLTHARARQHTLDLLE